MKCATRSLVL
jgi:insertion element IS1 protein InsB